MRDPARIDRVLNQLKALWMTYPDMRLCQLISNVMLNVHANIGGNDIFFIEDEKFEKMMQEYARNLPEAK